MASDEQINSAISGVRLKTDAEIIALLGKYPNPQHEVNIAAKQIQEERRLAAEKAKEIKEEARHKAIGDKLDELKKPHWTATPTFWAACIAVIVALFAWLFPRR